MKLRRTLLRCVKVAASSLCCLSLLMVASESNAQETWESFVDGLARDGVTAAPTVFHAETYADFETSKQGWNGGNLTTEAVGQVLGPVDPLTHHDGVVRGGVGASYLPGSRITVGDLPGQYDILQFDLRFDTLPPTASSATPNANMRGRTFFEGNGASGVNYYDLTPDPNNPTVPDLPLDNAFHTYTIRRLPSNGAWNLDYPRIRIDPVDGVSAANVADITGADFSIDNIIVGRSTSAAAFPVVPIVVTNFIKNGDVSAVSNEVFSPDGAPGFDINGSNGHFGPFRGSEGDVDHWEHYNVDPNGLAAAVNAAEGTGLNLLNNAGTQQGSFYADSHWASAERFSLNSAQNYLNGLIQRDILNGVTIDETATYELSFDVDYIHNAGATTLTVGLTTGTGTAATDSANALNAGAMFSDTVSNLDTNSTQTISVSGADLKAAQDAGTTVNLIAQSQCNTSIPGFPNSVSPDNHRSGTYNCQVRLDNFVLSVPFVAQRGDVNKDGVVTQADVDLAQNYLDGNGGTSAADRQAELSVNNANDAVLASLNLNDFDLVAPFNIFNADDVAAIQALVMDVVGDFDGDGDVDCDDLDGYIGNIGDPATGPLAALDFDTDGTISAADANSVITTLVVAGGVEGTFVGDFNCDGRVDVLGDAFILVGSLGQNVTSYSSGDATFDGAVDVLGDAFALVANLGNSNQ